MPRDFSIKELDVIVSQLRKGLLKDKNIVRPPFSDWTKTKNTVSGIITSGQDNKLYTNSQTKTLFDILVNYETMVKTSEKFYHDYSGTYFNIADIIVYSEGIFKNIHEEKDLHKTYLGKWISKQVFGNMLKKISFLRDSVIDGKKGKISLLKDKEIYFSENSFYEVDYILYRLAMADSSSNVLQKHTGIDDMPDFNKMYHEFSKLSINLKRIHYDENLDVIRDVQDNFSNRKK